MHIANRTQIPKADMGQLTGVGVGGDMCLGCQDKKKKEGREGCTTFIDKEAGSDGTSEPRNGTTPDIFPPSFPPVAAFLNTVKGWENVRKRRKNRWTTNVGRGWVSSFCCLLFFHNNDFEPPCFAHNFFLLLKSLTDCLCVA